MEPSEHKRLAFILLKEVCDSIILKPSREHSEKLNSVLTCIGENIVEEFVEYILYPIKLHIFNKNFKNRDDTNCILLDCLNQLLLHLKINTESLFIDIYSIICFTIVKGDSSCEVGVKDTSEELKLNALKSAKLLFKKTDKQFLISIYKKNECYSKLCVLIYNSLQFASKEKNISLRVEALECLLIICQLNLITTSEQTSLNLDLARFVKKCLPGLVTECRSIVSAGQTQNHQITVLALKLWSRSIALVMADCHNVSCKKPVDNLTGNFSAESNLKEMDSTFDDKTVLNNDDFNEKWVNSAAKRLSSTTDIFTMLKLHPHHKVRRELVSSVILILSHAPMNMNPSLKSLLDALIVLTEDNDELVAKASRKALESFKNSWAKARGRLLIEDVKDCLCSLLNRLPRILHGTDDCLKESDLALLCGYIQLLGREHFSEFISSQHLLDKLIICLIEATTLEVSHISLLEESTLRDVEDLSSTLSIPWRNFTICSTPKLKLQLEKIFHVLNTMTNLIDFSFSLLDNFNSTPFKRLELTLIINDVVLSSEQINDKKYLTIIKSMLNAYLEPYFWDCIQDQKGLELKKSAVQACLCIEGIGKLAKSIGPDQFSPFLFKCLYPILEYAGCPYSYLAQAGIQSIQVIARAYDCDVGILIKNNVDYLSHHITIKLKNAQKNVTVLYVLSAVMKNSNLNTLPSLMEIMNNVLIQSCDKFQSNNLGSYLLVFQTFISCLHSWIEYKENIDTPVTKEKSLLEMLTEYQKNKETAENLFADSDKMDDDYQEDKESNENLDESDLLEETKKESPDYIKLTEGILTRSAHFLPSKVVSQQLLVMQIIEHGSLILKDYQDVLLPVVHKIWSPLVERFDLSKEPLTINYAFRLLCTLASTSKDFIRQRSQKQVLPKICSLLEKLSIESKLKPQLHGYRFSQKYKLQLEIMKGLGDMVINIDINGKEIYTLLKSSQPYLSTKQPQPLQDACIELYIKLSKLNLGMVWLHLMSLWPRNELLKPKADFQRLYELPSTLENSHFSKNVETLLNILHNTSTT